MDDTTILTALLNKLGYKSGDTVLTHNAPDWFETLLKEHNIQLASSTPATWVHGFFTDKIQTQTWVSQLELANIEKGLWLSWPKKVSGVPTSVTEHLLREIVLPLGWVDVKVCSVNETWSGLKFLRRSI